MDFFANSLQVYYYPFDINPYCHGVKHFTDSEMLDAVSGRWTWQLVCGNWYLARIMDDLDLGLN